MVVAGGITSAARLSEQLPVGGAPDMLAAGNDELRARSRAVLRLLDSPSRRAGRRYKVAMFDVTSRPRCEPHRDDAMRTPSPSRRQRVIEARQALGRRRHADTAARRGARLPTCAGGRIGPSRTFIICRDEGVGPQRVDPLR